MRSAHVAAIAQRPDVARFHFLDETGLRLDYTRRYGRAQAGQRVSGAVPLRRPARSLTLIGALSVHGLHGVQVLEGALNQRSFALYISRILAPQLRRGDVLVLDNLRVHHLTGLREWLARRGIEVLFLPPTRPTLPPSSRPGASSKPSCATPRHGPATRSKKPYIPPSTGLLAPMRKRGLITVAITYTVHESAIVSFINPSGVEDGFQQNIVPPLIKMIGRALYL
ncbi:transposase [Hymenobacter sp. BRD128]|nr:transposase [Hymenobacter sp. BRD128]